MSNFKKTYFIFHDHDDYEERAILVFFGDVTERDIQDKIYQYKCEWERMEEEGKTKDSDCAFMEEYIFDRLSKNYAVDIVDDFKSVMY